MGRKREIRKKKMEKVQQMTASKITLGFSSTTSNTVITDIKSRTGNAPHYKTET